MALVGLLVDDGNALGVVGSTSRIRSGLIFVNTTLYFSRLGNSIDHVFTSPTVELLAEHRGFGVDSDGRVLVTGKD